MENVFDFVKWVNIDSMKDKNIQTVGKGVGLPANVKHISEPLKEVVEGLEQKQSDVIPLNPNMENTEDCEFLQYEEREDKCFNCGIKLETDYLKQEGYCSDCL